MTKNAVRSDLAQAPGEVLARELQKRSMSQAELARRMGRPVQAVNEIIKGDKAVSSETALQLEQVLGIDAAFWLNLDALYHLTRARQQELGQLEAEAALLDEFPVKEMLKWGWIRKVDGAAERVKELRHYFGVASLQNLDQVRTYAPAFRRAKDSKTYALAAWLHQATVEAGRIREKYDIGAFDAQKLRSKIQDFRRATCKSPAEFFGGLVASMAECGVALVLLPSISGTYANGATFWDPKGTPVLVVTDRYKFADIFWFTFFHELGHILLHGKRDGFVEIGGKKEAPLPDPELRLMEQEADSFAGETLIPTKEYLAFLSSCRYDFTAEAIRTFARQINIHPGIVVGRMMHDQFIPHSRFGDLRTRYEIRPEPR